MKMIKKLTAVVLAVVLTMALSISAFATNITITGTGEGSTYLAYRLLNTTTSLKVPGCHTDEKDHLSTCYNIAYSVNNTYETILKDKTSASDDAGIINYIKGLTAAEDIRKFADDVYAAISGTSPAITPDSTANGVNDTAILQNVAQGYWLIVETNHGDNAAHSLVMLDTAGSRNITVETKREEPALAKYVLDNAANYGSDADVQIGDVVSFALRGDVPSPSGYKNYIYLIHDEMSAGLTFDASSVVVHRDSVDGTVVNSDYYTVTYPVTATDDDKCTFHISVDIEKAIEAGALKAGDRIWITYNAVLNEDANILVDGSNTANANPNTAWLQYSNEPYVPEETTTTTAEKVYVWSFPLELNKVDSAQTPLKGAMFVLSENDKLTETNLKDSDGNGVPDDVSELIPMIKEDATGTTYRVVSKKYAENTDNAGKIVYAIDMEELATVNLQGFDDQTDYYLYETKAPAGYNQLNAPVSFRFYVEYNNDSTKEGEFAAGYPQVSINAGTRSSELKANVVNQTGIELPSTGGIGTTIFYVVGAILVLGAVVLLITKKRMNTEK